MLATSDDVSEYTSLQSINPPKLRVSQSVIEAKKGLAFINDKCLRDKRVEDLGGIGSEYAERFRQQHNVHYAYQLVGFYLMHGKNEHVLEEFLYKTIGNKRNVVVAKNCIVDWVNLHF